MHHPHLVSLHCKHLKCLASPSAQWWFCLFVCLLAWCVGGVGGGGGGCPILSQVLLRIVLSWSQIV